jgi:hypothetical protein
MKKTIDPESLIDLDKIPEKKKFGSFWKLTGLTFDDYFSSVFANRFITLNIVYNSHLFHLKVYKNRYKPEIDIYLDSCIKYKLSSTEATLSEFSTDCEDVFKGVIKISQKANTKSQYLLDFIDAISIAFGISRLSLIDGATPKLNRDIDLSLYMVMKYNQTFYERYQFTFCQNDNHIQHQKRLLQSFDFDTFYKLLDQSQKKFVDRRLKTNCKNRSDYRYLGPFYVDSYDYLRSISSENRLLQLQNLLNDSSKPWFSMVHSISQRKQCMEKLYTK